jgi:hypothetical protein
MLSDHLFQDDLDDVNLVNYNMRKTSNLSKGFSTDGNLQINRKLNSKGRNITFRLSYGYNDDDSDQYAESKVRYFKKIPLHSPISILKM